MINSEYWAVVYRMNCIQQYGCQFMPVAEFAATFEGHSDFYDDMIAVDMRSGHINFTAHINWCACEAC